MVAPIPATTGVNVATNFDPVAMTVNSSGQIFLLDTNPDQIVEIDPNTGATVGAPIAVSGINLGGTTAGGLRIDSSTGYFWVGMSSDNRIAVIQPDGTLDQVIDLSSDGLTTSVLTGIDFLSGDLLVSSARGVVYRFAVPGSPTSVVAGDHRDLAKLLDADLDRFLADQPQFDENENHLDRDFDVVQMVKELEVNQDVVGRLRFDFELVDGNADPWGDIDRLFEDSLDDVLDEVFV
jgi:DNA-binding beta-propeller fold protein YncE